MDSYFFRSISNSEAVYEPFFTEAPGYVVSFTGLSQHSGEIQSSAVTPSGFLWMQVLAYMASENPFTVSESEFKRNKIPQSIPQSPKNHALIELLRSWREGDEQEQRNTWECLKQALDEDRLSERKLFP